MARPTSEVIKLENVRLSFPRVFTPEAFQEGQDKKFQATFLLDKSDASHAAKIKEIKQAAKKLMVEAYGSDFKPAGLKGVCFGDGDNQTNAEGEVLDGYEGAFFVRSSNTTRPAVANRRGEPVAEGDPQTPYAGAFVNGTVTLWAQDNKFGKRINCNLRGVQFVKDGEAFGQAPVSVESEFDALDDNTPADSGGGDDWDTDTDW